MFKQERLIRELDKWFVSETGINCMYEKLCGKFTLEDLFTTDSVYIAAKRCASGFMHKNDTWYFMQNAWPNSRALCEKVLSGKFKPRYYPERVIIERGKARVIKPPTFECKVVQKVLCDYMIKPLLTPKMIETNYASITGRGTAKMYEDIINTVNKYVDTDDEYSVVIADFKGYFASIDIGILLNMLGRYIKDERVLDLIGAFSPDDFGLSLGNELSQIPASFFPSYIDHKMKDKHRIDYFRYMDDSLAIVRTDMADGYIRSYQKLAKDLNLKCPDEKIRTYRIGDSFVFCKERFVFNKKSGMYDRLINPKAISNERKKLKTFDRKIGESRRTEEEKQTQLRSAIGSIKQHPHTYKAVQELELLAGGRSA